MLYPWIKVTGTCFFCPNRGCHDAIQAVYDHVSTHSVETVIDVDLSNYFGSISHDELIEAIRHKIGDDKLIRYLWRMFKSGVLANNELTISDEGVPQGSGCSPILANILAHYVLDDWIETTVKAHCAGRVKMVRYADDIVICCQYERDAIRIKKALRNRLAKYGLAMNEDKTKLVSFSKRQQSRGYKQGTFDFLGFTFYYGKSRKGFYVAKLKTSGQRLRSKLKKVNDWARNMRNKVNLKQFMRLAAAKNKRTHPVLWGVS